MSTIGNKIKSLRKKKEFTQLELALAIGVDRSTVTNWECNRSKPRREDLKKLAEFFEVSVEHFLYSEESIIDVTNKVIITTPENVEFLKLYSKLNKDNRDKIIKQITDYLLEQNNY